jgi:hypothetical protein
MKQCVPPKHWHSPPDYNCLSYIKQGQEKEFARHTRRWEDSIKMDFDVTGLDGVEWIHLARQSSCEDDNVLTPVAIKRDMTPYRQEEVLPLSICILGSLFDPSKRRYTSTRLYGVTPQTTELVTLMMLWDR